MSQRDGAIHLFAGGVAGTAGAVVTCPLEVVKTRLQSSRGVPGPRTAHSQMIVHMSRNGTKASSRVSLIQCIRHIVETEGARALFKGLGPNIVGVAPSRAIYFCTYSRAKAFANKHFQPETPLVHITAAFAAGFVASTTTNPIWFVKTRLQLDGQVTTAGQCIKRIYAQSGILGFYKGISASYIGISETVVHFVLYEGVKARLVEARRQRQLAGGGAGEGGQQADRRQPKDFLEFMAAGAFSKTVASCIAYPHEVARTRLREEGNKYRFFWQTLHTVWMEEGHRGVYRGLATQLVRQIPNTAIMMATYEAVVYILTAYYNTSFYDNT